MSLKPTKAELEAKIAEGKALTKTEQNSLEWFQRIDKLESVRPEDKEEIEDLPQWVRMALTYKIANACTWKEAADAFKHSPKTLAKYKKSPAARKFLEPLREWRANPINVAEAMLKGNALGVTLDRLMFLEQAKAAGDYAAGDKIAADLQSRMGIVPKKFKNDAPTKVVIQIPGGMSGGALQVPSVEAEFEILSEQEDEDDED